jgi:hypothetical protein
MWFVFDFLFDLIYWSNTVAPVLHLLVLFLLLSLGAEGICETLRFTSVS